MVRIVVEIRISFTISLTATWYVTGSNDDDDDDDDNDGSGEFVC